MSVPPYMPLRPPALADTKPSDRELQLMAQLQEEQSRTSCSRNRCTEYQQKLAAEQRTHIVASEKAECTIADLAETVEKGKYREILLSNQLTKSAAASNTLELRVRHQAKTA